LAAHYEDKIAVTFALEELAFERDILISEPFQGMQIGPMTVMSPHRDWYVHRLIHDFEDPPLARRRISADLARILHLSGVRRAEEHASAGESWDIETLSESGDANAEMESSVVLHGMIGGHGILLTGNAGIKALSNAAAYAEHQRIFVPESLKFLQVPRRGDSDHVSPSVLDRLIGTRHPQPLANSRVTAFVSTPYGSMEYPHCTVVNALSRRGVAVMHAQGSVNASYRFGSDANATPIEIVPFSGEKP
jgi:hypothetical protein